MIKKNLFKKIKTFTAAAIVALTVTTGATAVAGVAGTGFNLAGLLNTTTAYAFEHQSYADNTGYSLRLDGDTWHCYNAAGEIDYSYDGLALNDFGWWKVSNGTADFTFTGLALNEYGWWYAENGTINFDYKGMAENEYGWWYVSNGTVDFTYTGMALNRYGWWYLTNGTVDFTYNGMALNEYGWWKMTGGALDLTFNGIAENEYGSWKLAGGVVDFGFTGSYEYDGKTYEIAGGYVTSVSDNDTSDNTGNNTGADNSGKDNGNADIDTSLNGLTYDGATDLWYYYVNGVLDVNNNGLVEYNGYLFKLANGVLDVNYTGTYYNDGMYYYVKKGAVKTSAAEGTDEAKLLAINKFAWDEKYNGLNYYMFLDDNTKIVTEDEDGTVYIQRNALIVSFDEDNEFYNMTVPYEMIDAYGHESFYGLDATLNTVANLKWDTTYTQ